MITGKLMNRVIIGLLLLLGVSEAGEATQDATEISAKIDLRFGDCGPRRPSVFHPNEMIFFTVSMRGLITDKENSLKVKCLFELRSKSGDLVAVIRSNEVTHTPDIGQDAMLVMGAVKIPPKYPPGELEIWVNLVDGNSKQEVTEKITIAIKKPEGVYPLNVLYALDPEGDVRATGRFVEGQHVFLSFFLAGVSPTDKVKCTLTFIPDDKTIKTRPMTFTLEGTEDRPLIDNKRAQFSFNPSCPFEGVAKLAVEDSEKHTYEIDIPLSVSECLR